MRGHPYRVFKGTLSESFDSQNVSSNNFAITHQSNILDPGNGYLEILHQGHILPVKNRNQFSGYFKSSQLTKMLRDCQHHFQKCLTLIHNISHTIHVTLTNDGFWIIYDPNHQGDNAINPIALPISNTHEAALEIINKLGNAVVIDIATLDDHELQSVYYQKLKRSYLHHLLKDDGFKTIASHDPYLTNRILKQAPRKTKILKTIKQVFTRPSPDQDNLMHELGLIQTFPVFYKTIKLACRYNSLASNVCAMLTQINEKNKTPVNYLYEHDRSQLAAAIKACPKKKTGILAAIIGGLSSVARDNNTVFERIRRATVNQHNMPLSQPMKNTLHAIIALLYHDTSFSKSWYKIWLHQDSRDKNLSHKLIKDNPNAFMEICLRTQGTNIPDEWVRKLAKSLIVTDDENNTPLHLLKHLSTDPKNQLLNTLAGLCETYPNFTKIVLRGLTITNNYNQHVVDMLLGSYDFLPRLLQTSYVTQQPDQFISQLLANRQSHPLLYTLLKHSSYAIQLTINRAQQCSHQFQKQLAQALLQDESSQKTHLFAELIPSMSSQGLHYVLDFIVNCLQTTSDIKLFFKKHNHQQSRILDLLCHYGSAEIGADLIKFAQKYFTVHKALYELFPMEDPKRTILERLIYYHPKLLPELIEQSIEDHELDYVLQLTHTLSDDICERLREQSPQTLNEITTIYMKHPNPPLVLPYTVLNESQTIHWQNYHLWHECDDLFVSVK